MLPLDQGGVVDSNLKVYGTDNVFAGDASIIPLVCHSQNSNGRIE